MDDRLQPRRRRLAPPPRRMRGYLKQQVEYGKAEALLERKWPERYNRGGHLAWAGRVYGAPRRAFWRRWKIYYGTWGAAGSSSPSTSRLPGSWVAAADARVAAGLAGVGGGSAVDPLLAVPLPSPRARSVSATPRSACTGVSAPRPLAADTGLRCGSSTGLPVHAPAGRTPQRPPPLRARTLAAHRRPGSACRSAHRQHLERALAERRRRVARLDTALAPRSAARGPTAAATTTAGTLGARRPARRRAPAAGGRGARRRPATGADPLMPALLAPSGLAVACRRYRSGRRWTAPGSAAVSRFGGHARDPRGNGPRGAAPRPPAFVRIAPAETLPRCTRAGISPPARRCPPTRPDAAKRRQRLDRTPRRLSHAP